MLAKYKPYWRIYIATRATVCWFFQDQAECCYGQKFRLLKRKQANNKHINNRAAIYTLTFWLYSWNKGIAQFSQQAFMLPDFRFSLLCCCCVLTVRVLWKETQFRKLQRIECSPFSCLSIPVRLYRSYESHAAYSQVISQWSTNPHTFLPITDIHAVAIPFCNIFCGGNSLRTEAAQY